MKNKIITGLLIILSLTFLTACNPFKEEEVYFTGTIVEITDQMAIVEIDEGVILSSGDIAAVDLSVEEETTFEEGDRVEVAYDGIVRESYPLGINTISVKLIDD